MTATGEPADGMAMHGPDGAFEIFGTWRRRRVEDELSFRSTSKDAVQKDDVEVDVQVEASAEALDERDGAVRTRPSLETQARFASRGRMPRWRLRRSGRAPTRPSRRTPQAHGARTGARAPIGVRVRPADAIDEMSRGVGHAPSGAARTEAAQLAGEGDEEIRVAGVAVSAKEAVSEDAAAVVCPELVAGGNAGAGRRTSRGRARGTSLGVLARASRGPSRSDGGVDRQLRAQAGPAPKARAMPERPL